MAFKFLVLVCSLTVPTANPSHRDVTPCARLDPVSCNASSVSPADGHFYRLLEGCDDLSWTTSLRSDLDNESEDDLQIPAFACGHAGAISLATTLISPAHPSPLAARFARWRTPLRC
jgi:hypothetical protein